MSALSSLTVLFEPPFWIGLYERTEDGRYEVCKITFGVEPKDREVYDFLLQNWGRLSFSPAVCASQTAQTHKNPKRTRREISRRLRQDAEIGTKAQQALKLQREQGKLARQAQTRAQMEAEQERRYALRQEKKKAKHRGR